MAVDDSLWQCSMYDIVKVGISNYVASTTCSKHDECWHPLAPLGTLWHPGLHDIFTIGEYTKKAHSERSAWAFFMPAESRRKEQIDGVQKSDLCRAVLVSHQILVPGSVPQKEVISCPESQRNPVLSLVAQT